jgi:PhoH-like ATPase
MRLKANSIGIKAQSFKDDIFPSLEEQYKGRVECQTSEVKLQRFLENGTMPVKDIYQSTSIEWMPNLFLQITSPNNEKSSLARFNGKEIVKLNYNDYHPYRITAQNAGQLMLLESLMEGPETAPLVIIKGGAGTGKTYVCRLVNHMSHFFKKYIL